MRVNDPVSRRRFLGSSPLLAAAAATAARTAKAQINDASAPPPKPVRLGFIGVGIRGHLLMEAAAGLSGVELVAAADCYRGHLDRARELFPGVAVTGAYGEVLSRADVDAVVIATPDHWHLKMLKDALGAGKHVYVEKPLSHSWEEGEEFIAAAERGGKAVQVGSQYMSAGCAQQAAALIKGGRLGQVTLVEGRMHRNSATGAWYYPIPPDASPETVDWKGFLGPAPKRPFDLARFFQWRLFWDYSGGLPTDLFVHMVTATHQLMGVQEPDSVVAFGDVYHWKNYREVPDQMTALARYPEGFVLKLTSTAANAHPGPLLTFYGTEGTLEYDGNAMKLFHEPRSESFVYSTRSWPSATVARFRELMDLDETLSPVDGPTVAEAIEYRSPHDEDATRAHVRNWIQAIRSGGRPIEDVPFGFHAALVGHMCNVSYRAGKTVRWDRNARRVEA